MKQKSTRVAIFDLDGTLFSHNAKINQQNKLAIQTLAQEYHYRIIIATGRGLNWKERIKKQLPSLHYFVGNNGATTYDFISHKETITSHLMEKRIFETLKNYVIKEKLILIILETHARTRIIDCFDNHDLDLVVGNTFYDFIDANKVELKDAVFLPDQIISFEILGPEEKIETILKAKKEWQQQFPDYQFLYTTSQTIDIVHAQVSKWNGIKQILQKYNIDPQDPWSLIAFGDSLNDLSFMQKAHYSFAMADAMPEIKAIANETIGSCQSDSIAQTLEKYIFKKNKFS